MQFKYSIYILVSYVHVMCDGYCKKLSNESERLASKQTQATSNIGSIKNWIRISAYYEYELDFGYDADFSIRYTTHT